MIELERTFLAKFIPEEVKSCPAKEIIDIYIPQSAEHPKTRIRKVGSVLEITKKEPLVGNDSSEQEEQTIKLSEAEFAVLAQVPGKKTRKLRYYWNSPYGPAEVDIFQDALKGLVLVDFEFAESEKKNNFTLPDFCLADVTQEKFTAGGMLCGKNYQDIEEELKRFNYQAINGN